MLIVSVEFMEVHKFTVFFFQISWFNQLNYLGSLTIGGSKGGRQGRAPPPGSPNSSIFMQFSANN